MGKFKRNGIVKLKVVMEVLQRSLGFNRGMIQSSSSSSSFWDESGNSGTGQHAPEDVKEGHFAVVADDGVEEPRRLVVPLSCLRQPRFLVLLDRAAEEYGFHRPDGALRVPCRPSEVERLVK